MLDAHPAPDALARPSLPALAIDPPAFSGPSGRGRCPVRGGPDSAAHPGGRPAARRRDPPGGHDAGLRRIGCRRRLGLEGRLRGSRSRRRAVRAALRPCHAPTSRSRTARAAPDAGDAGRDRRAGAVAHEALRGAGPPAAVLDAAAARLCRAPGRRHPAGRHRAGALGRHRHARGHGRMRDGRPGRGQSPSQRIRRRARPPPDPSVPAGGHYRLQRGSHRRPAP